MNTRVRYVKKGNLLRSRTFDADEGKKLFVEINTSNFTYVIVNENTGLPVREGGENTLLLLKKNVKNALTEFGVMFEPEYRVYGLSDDKSATINETNVSEVM